MSYSTIIRELGYPSRVSLQSRHNEYLQNGELHKGFIKQPKCTEEEKQRAVNYYFKHGKCISRTVKEIGYPYRPILDKWISELAPEEKRHCRSGGVVIKYTREQKEQAVISLCSRRKSGKKVTTEHGTIREILYNWKHQLLKRGCAHSMSNRKQIKH